MDFWDDDLIDWGEEGGDTSRTIKCVDVLLKNKDLLFIYLSFKKNPLWSQYGHNNGPTFINVSLELCVFILYIVPTKCK